jgi:hypothetical protein
MRSGQQIVTLTLNRFARYGASRADLAARSFAHCPYRLERRGLALNRLEPLHVDRNPIVRGEIC